MSRAFDSIRRVLSELRRRNVYKVAAAYLAVAFVGLQAAELLVPSTTLPTWTDDLLIYLAVFGFPIALVLAWAFDMTAEGVRRTPGVADSPETPGAEDLPDVSDRSIAVLPLESVGGEESVQLAQGVHDDLLTRLSNVSGLKVISRTSVERYRNADRSIPEIARELNVRWILEGRVQQARDQIRVNAQLIDAREDDHLWAETYQRELTTENLFAVQSELTKRVAGSLEAELTPQEEERVERQPTKNLAAYRLCVRGRKLLSRRTEESIRQARSYFEQALEEDETYALAWAGLADAEVLYAAYSSDSDQEFAEGMRAAIPEARKQARRALELDPDLAAAHATLGIISIYEQRVKPDQRNGPRALEELERAVELEPSYAQAHHWLGELQLYLGRPGPALEHLGLALELNPEHFSARLGLIDGLLATGRHEEALEMAHHLQEKYPDQVAGAVWEAYVLVHMKRWEEVRETLRPYLAETEETDDFINRHWAQTYLALADVATGDEASARDRLEELRRHEERGSTWAIALVHAALGNKDEALAALRAPYEEGRPRFPAYGSVRHGFPDVLRSVREDPRYQELIRDMNRDWGLNSDGSIPDAA